MQSTVISSTVVDKVELSRKIHQSPHSLNGKTEQSFYVVSYSICLNSYTLKNGFLYIQIH